MPGPARPRRLQSLKAGPLARILALPGQPRAERKQRLRDLVMPAPESGFLHQGGRRLAEGAGMNLLCEALNVSCFIQLDSDHHAASAGRRPQLRAAILALQLARFRE